MTEAELLEIIKIKDQIINTQAEYIKSLQHNFLHLTKILGMNLQPDSKARPITPL